VSVIGFIQFIIIGWVFLKLIRFSGLWQEKLGLSFILGSGLQTVTYFWLITRTNITNQTTYLGFAIILLAILSFLYLVSKKIFPDWISRPINVTEVDTIHRKKIMFLSWLCIFVLFIIAVTLAIYTPVHTTDSIHLYDFRAKIMYYSQSLSAIRQIDYWYTYPMFSSMIHLFVYYFGLQNPSIYWPIMLLSFALIFYALLKKEKGPTIASLVTLAMYSTPLIFWQSRLDGLTNLPYTILYCTAIFYAIEAVKPVTTNLSALLVSALATSLSIWTRANEPFWTVPIVVVFLTILAKKRLPLSALLYYLLISPIKNMWNNYAQTITNIDLTSGVKGVITSVKFAPSSSADHAIVADKYLLRITTNIIIILSQALATLGLILPVLFQSLSPVIYIFFPMLLLGSSNQQKLLLASIVLTALLLWGGSTFVYINFDWQLLDNPLSRLSGIFIPLMWMYIAQSSVWQSISFLSPVPKNNHQ